jgi:hypothetical protein
LRVPPGTTELRNGTATLGLYNYIDYGIPSEPALGAPNLLGGNQSPYREVTAPVSFEGDEVRIYLSNIEGFDPYYDGIAYLRLGLEDACGDATLITDLIFQTEPFFGEGLGVRNLRKAVCEEQDLGREVSAFEGNFPIPLVYGELRYTGDDQPTPACAEDPAFVAREEVTFAWAPPVAGVYYFDTRGSGLDTVVHVRPPACFGVVAGSEEPCVDNYFDGETFSTGGVVEAYIPRTSSVVITITGYPVSFSDNSFQLSIYALQ